MCGIRVLAPITGNIVVSSANTKATLDDVAKLLEQLNKTMAQVAHHSESISEASHKTAKNSAKATGNKNLA